MKIRPIKAVLLSVALCSSMTVFSSCGSEKKEETAATETPVEVAEIVEKVAEEVETPSEATAEAVEEIVVAEKETTPAPPAKEAKTTKTAPAEEKVEEAVTETEAGKPVMTFDHSSFDFGTIKQGDKVEHLFTFTNTGNAPLIINSAKPSCGCTVPSWPKEPIMPGETGEIKAVFNSSHKSGQQNKSIRVFTNMGEQAATVFLKGNVVVPAPTETPETH